MKQQSIVLSSREAFFGSGVSQSLLWRAVSYYRVYRNVRLPSYFFHHFGHAVLKDLGVYMYRNVLLPFCFLTISGMRCWRMFGVVIVNSLGCNSYSTWTVSCPSLIANAMSQWCPRAKCWQHGWVYVIGRSTRKLTMVVDPLALTVTVATFPLSTVLLGRCRRYYWVVQCSTRWYSLVRAKVRGAMLWTGQGTHYNEDWYTH